MKVQHQDIQSHSHALDTLAEKVKAITQKSPESRAQQTVADITARYKAVCTRSDETLAHAKQSLADHQKYDDLLLQLDDKLSQVSNQLSSVSATLGDRFVLQGKVEALQVSCGIFLDTLLLLLLFQIFLDQSSCGIVNVYSGVVKPAVGLRTSHG